MKLIRTSSQEETFSLGEALGRCAFPGAVLALEGGLGAGKTLLTKGIGRGLGVGDSITSPTFLLMILYEGARLDLVHMDLYRLGSAVEMEDAGLLEYVGKDVVTVVEWADRFRSALPGDLLRVRMSFVPGQSESRDISIHATGEDHRVFETCPELALELGSSRGQRTRVPGATGAQES